MRNVTWRTIDTAIWSLVPLAGTVLFLAGAISQDGVTSGLGILVAAGGAAKAASTL
ncbi:MAG: hypothetical protein AB7P11_21230 [Hydrogenophaga sp.]|uniref:hypothetical protein n=1 Tax=Hydrogenophaga sp. TaxID=1904254 RepID=UPI003D0E58C9